MASERGRSLRGSLDRLAQTAERMARLLYIDAIGGAAGDMLLAALIDAGADAQRVQRGLAGLGIDGLEVRVDRASRQGLAARTVTVVAPDSQPHRSWTDVKRLLDDAEVPAGVRRRAHEVFAVLARAEAKVHGVDAEQVHFHEVGALDALADVCAERDVWLHVDGAYGLPAARTAAAGHLFGGVERADGRVEMLKATAFAKVEPGDRFVIETPGGGGYGRRSE